MNGQKILEAAPFWCDKMKLKIIHNPRCSKSRQAKKLLEDNNVSFETILYLVNPLKENDLEKILNNLPTKPKSLVRIKEKLFKDLEIDLANSTVTGQVDTIAVSGADGGSTYTTTSSNTDIQSY